MDILLPPLREPRAAARLDRREIEVNEFLQRVREMDERAKINLDNESRELILVGHAYLYLGEAGQIYRH